jgi:hypothetical protein
MKYVISIRTPVSNSVYEIEASSTKDALDRARKMAMAVTGLPSPDIHMTAYGPYIKLEDDDVIRVPLALQDADGNFARGRIEVTDTAMEVFMDDYENKFVAGGSILTMQLHNEELELIIWDDENDKSPQCISLEHMFREDE